MIELMSRFSVIEESMVSSIISKLKKTRGKEFFLKKSGIKSGELNFNFLLSSNGNDFVLSIPRDNQKIVKSIAEEYSGIGFRQTGEEYSFRTAIEQEKFSNTCLEHGFFVPKVIYCEREFLFREFIEGEIYEEHLRKTNEPSQAIKNFLSEIRKANKLGIIFGDRWGPNELVLENNKIGFFDFNIKLLSPRSKEFEISQAVYYSIINSKNKKEAVREVELFFSENETKNVYSYNLIKNFLEGHVRFFKNGYEEISKFQNIHTFEKSSKL